MISKTGEWTDVVAQVSVVAVFVLLGQIERKYVIAPVRVLKSLLTKAFGAGVDLCARGFHHPVTSTTYAYNSYG